jgi:Na+-transporting NADH:ubiquinone oxidoreductase subunit E
MCSFLAISKRVDTSIGLGFAVTFVLTITAPANWAIHHYFLEDGALSWAGLPEVNLSFLNFIVFIAAMTAIKTIKFKKLRFTSGNPAQESAPSSKK